MKKLTLYFILLLFINVSSVISQTNIISTNPVAEQVMKGNYDPSYYTASNVIMHPDSISRGVNKRVSPDSLLVWLKDLSSFQTRNSGSDTTSLVRGIGAARKWVFKKFDQFRVQNENRLIPSYLQFDLAICGTNRHKNAFAVLPGTDTSDKSVIIIEAHLDSRCEVLCDTACLAEGMEDNGSGSALVVELARVMSKYSYKNTLVFIATTAEEQGLLGANAFAVYAKQNGITIKAVLNNDVIGGVICGKTSSPPSCSGTGSIDSTHVRMFSFGGFNSPHKGLARFVKLQYNEMIRPIATVPMTLHVMTPEDRSGRGGDHIPFRQNNYTAIRFTSANEHGDANVANQPYTDRQHTSTDVLGVDTNADQIIDSFFVDFNYLARNAVINGNAAAMAAIGPRTPDFNLSASGNDMFIDITKETSYLAYRIGLRTLTFDWDTVYSVAGSASYTLTVPNNNYIVSIASVDNKGVESLFSREQMLTVNSIRDLTASKVAAQLMQNLPNPADEATSISVWVNKPLQSSNAYILINDMGGKEVSKLPISLKQGINEVIYEHGYHASGTFVYSLIIDGKTVQSRKMVFTD
jgi:hypothetical protein